VTSDLVDIKLTVNGTRYEGRAEPRKLLVDFLREDLGLTGTHAGCEHGICGVCTVLFNGEAARSCIMVAVQAEGAEITTSPGTAISIRCRRRFIASTGCNAASARRAC
jgi:aerobic-type carbon monoxide dehydrogenase small subunit (CoxS/CutS family)